MKDFLDAVYQFPGGVLAVRFGHRNALVAFNAIAITGYVVLAGASSWVVVVLALPLVMAWQSFSLPATFALVGDSLPRGQRSMAFAYQSIVRRVPIVVAPIVGGAIIARYGTISGTKIAIWIGVAVALVALVLQTLRYSAQTTRTETLPIRTMLLEASRLHGTLKALLLTDCVVRFGQGIGEVFVVLYAIRVVGVSAATFGWLVGLAMATSIAAYIPAARVADARGRAPWVLLTYAFFALFPLLVGLSTTPLMLALAFVAMGLREIGEPPRKAMIVDLAREDRRAVDIGAYYLVRGLTVFPASLVGGFVWRLNPSLTFLLAAAVAAVGASIYGVTVLPRARAAS